MYQILQASKIEIKTIHKNIHDLLANLDKKRRMNKMKWKHKIFNQSMENAFCRRKRN